MNPDRLWYRRHPARWLLWPVSLLYGAITRLRRLCYQHGWLRSERMPVPVIVVGNLSVGGTGKTPMVIWMVERLRARGWRPGVISRGYGGRGAQWPVEVNADSDPAMVGDEPVLLAQRLNCPVVVGPRRGEAGRKLLSDHEIDIIVADDGLQHYALDRDIEIVVVDGLRGFGNGMQLPAGPLREPVSRLAEVDWVVTHGADGKAGRMDLQPEAVVRLDGGDRRPLAFFAGRRVHAVAGIGNPDRFFSALRAAGLLVMPRAFPDHHIYRAQDLDFADNDDVIMTEKDAVKCRAFAGQRHWYLQVQAKLDAKAEAWLDKLLQRLPARP